MLWAVVTGRDNPEGQRFDLTSGLFHGTAFALGPTLSLTAGHVYAGANDAKGNGTISLARFGPEGFFMAPIADAEIFEHIDVALLYSPDVTAAATWPLLFTPLEFLSDVFSLGYAFGFEPPYPYLRAFKGHVVTRRRLSALSGSPPGYEISFVPPVGLSDAPLLAHSAAGVFVAGIILKHQTAEYKDRRMDLGLAVDVEELLTLDSRIVGGSLAEIVLGRPRLVR